MPYRLDVTIRPPSDETENKYLAEVPALPGCRAWGDTLPEALAIVQSVAAGFIASYRERGDTLPEEVESLTGETDALSTDILISA